ncbi:MAG: hypothetical protein AB7W47_04120 [Calditrichaceae bacterium]
MRKIIFLLWIVFISLLISCDENSRLSLAFSPPKCTLAELEKKDYTPGSFARISYKATNVSDPIAFSVACIIKLKKGNLIVDRSSVYFGTLESGESSIEDAVFSKIKTHTEYDDVEITLSWYDANNEYYEKSY